MNRPSNRRFVTRGQFHGEPLLSVTLTVATMLTLTLLPSSTIASTESTMAFPEQPTMPIEMPLSRSPMPEIPAIPVISIPRKGTTHLTDEAVAEKLPLNAHSDSLEQTPRLFIHDKHVEFQGHTIGDSHRSSNSFQSFFDSVDLDGDGKIRRPELNIFLSDKIGGTAFDEQNEIETEVGSIMDELDLEGDGRLEMGDVSSYLDKVESLLTVEEVAEWIVHAGQLPKEVGRIFGENHVTGYDFPELVERNGQAIKDELNIEKKYRTKIIRAVNARLLGIGTVPSAPGGIVENVESCSTIALSWKKAHTTNLPVHKYRVMRRKIGGSRNHAMSGGRKKANYSHSVRSDVCDTSEAEDLDGNFDNRSGALIETPHVGTGGSCEAPAMNFEVSSTVQPRSEWTTVYDGSETEYVDGGLKYGPGYIYRIQAWNMAGKSEWVEFGPSKGWFDLDCNFTPDIYGRKARRLSIESEKKSKATEQTQNRKSDNFTNPGRKNISSVNQLVKILTGWGKFIVNAIFTFFALLSALRRYQRATIKTTAIRMEPIWPWICRQINEVCQRQIGREILPEFFFEEQEETMNLHDDAVNMKGLHGYEKFERDKFNQTQRLARDINEIPDVNTPPKAETNLDQDKTKSARFKKEQSIFFRKRSQKSSRDESEEEICEICPDVTLSPEDAKTNVGAMTEKEAVLTRALFKVSSKNSPPRDLGEAKSPEMAQKPEFDTKKKARKNASGRYKRGFKENPLTNIDNIVCKEISYRSMNSTGIGNCKIENQPLDPEKETRKDCCNICKKKYKLLKRWRHHCASCGNSFCHKHGKTTHSSIVPCKVPGNCFCNNCIEQQKLESSS